MTLEVWFTFSALIILPRLFAVILKEFLSRVLDNAGNWLSLTSDVIVHTKKLLKEFFLFVKAVTGLLLAITSRIRGIFVLLQNV